MKTFLQALSVLLTTTLLISCATNKVVISPDGVVRLGADVSGHVYSYNDKTKTWDLSRNKVTLPEGWYCHSFNPK